MRITISQCIVLTYLIIHPSFAIKCNEEKNSKETSLSFTVKRISSMQNLKKKLIRKL